MQLIYRGNIFDYTLSDTNSAKVSQAASRNIQQPVKLIYRGATYAATSDAKAADAVKPQVFPHTLIYRGSTYVVNAAS
jgi:Domain of unknown function (DUF4278)